MSRPMNVVVQGSRQGRRHEHRRRRGQVPASGRRCNAAVVVRRYDWSFVDLPAEWTVRHHHQYPAVFRRQLAAAAIALGGPLGALNRKPGDLMFQMAGALHGLMGFGVEPKELKKQPCAKCKIEVGSRLCSACHQIGYCSRECQKAHWKVHKAWCKRNKAAK